MVTRIATIVAILSIAISAFYLGWVFGRRKFSKTTAVQVIKNLEDTIEIYKATHKEQMDYLSKKYTELKIKYIKCKKDNKPP